MNPEEIDIGGEVPVDESVKINGPPGMGKTTQGLRRVHELVENDEYDYSVDDVAWVTYRKSLAEDILRRGVEWGLFDLDALERPLKGKTRLFGTVHAVARRISGDERYYECDPASWYDKRDFMEGRYSLPHSTQNPSSADYGELIFRVRDWLISNQLPMTAASRCPAYDDLQSAWSVHPDLVEFDDAWGAYKKDHNLLDYSEYLTDALEYERQPDADIIVIDEYHDTTPLMHNLLQRWISCASIVIVLGDPQQVVNIHEGASPKHFEELDLPEVLLEKTWRVPKRIWSAATDQIAGSHEPVSPDFERGGGEICEVTPDNQLLYDTTLQEWLFDDTPASNAPSELVQERTMSSGEGSVMLLARTQRQVAGISAELRERGVIHRSQTGDGWRSDDRLRDLYNAISRLTFVDVEDVGWHSWDIKWRDDVDSEHQFADFSENPPTALRAGEAQALIRYIPAEWLDCDRKGAEQVVGAIDGSVSVIRVKDLIKDGCWNELTEGPVVARKLVQRQGEDSLDLDVLRKALDQNNCVPTIDVNDDGDGLDDYPVCRTIHASKGSEAESVVLYDGVTRRIMDSVRASFEQAENEDRVWYVGITRASKELVVVRDAFSWTEPWIPPVNTIGRREQGVEA